MRNLDVRPGVLKCLALALCALLLAGDTVSGQQHRAVRLGNPSTRFAPPLSHPDQLRRLFANPALRSDIQSILNQAGWSGDLQDLLSAAATAEIREIRLPRGSRLPFMSSRKDGKPVALMDVLWDGEQPIEAYAFDFQSRARIFRCITPKPCSNFYVVNLGSVPPSIAVSKLMPATASICDAVDITLAVTNSGKVKLTSVELSEALPESWKTTRGETAVRVNVGDLRAGESKLVTYKATADAPGRYVTKVMAHSLEHASAAAFAEILIGAPALSLACTAPNRAPVGRPVTVKVFVSNVGDRAEPALFVTMTPPPELATSATEPNAKMSEGRLTWVLPELPPGATNAVTLTFSSAAPLVQAFDVAASGICAPPVDARCFAEVTGVPAILLEVIDLEDPIEVNGQVVYEIRVTNQGSSTDKDIRLRCSLDESQELISASGATEFRAEGRQVESEPLARLDPKQTATWRVSCRPVAAADARFKVQLTSAEIDRPVEETESTRHY
jgi:hypothetical protein